MRDGDQPLSRGRGPAAGLASWFLLGASAFAMQDPAGAGDPAAAPHVVPFTGAIGLTDPDLLAEEWGGRLTAGSAGVHGARSGALIDGIGDAPGGVFEAAEAGPQRSRHEIRGGAGAVADRLVVDLRFVPDAGRPAAIQLEDLSDPERTRAIGRFELADAERQVLHFAPRRIATLEIVMFPREPEGVVSVAELTLPESTLDPVARSAEDSGERPAAGTAPVAAESSPPETPLAPLAPPSDPDERASDPSSPRPGGAAIGLAERTADPTRAASPRLLVLLDASSAMLAPAAGATSRIDAAKAALTEVTEALPRDVSFGLRAYGSWTPRPERKDCRDSRLLVSLGPPDSERLRLVLGRTRARGTAALAYAIEQAAVDLAGGTGPARVVLIASRGDECGGDAEAMVHDLRHVVPGAVVHVVALAADKGEEAGLARLAAAGGGELVRVGEGAELSEQLLRLTLY